MSCVIFLAAHADDLELGAGGTCAMLCDRGYDVRVIVVTDEADPTVAGLRRREAVLGARTLGVNPQNVHFLGLPDGYVTCNRQTVTAIRSLVADFGVQPVAVFTHTQSDSHQDHVETTKIARAAFRQVSMFKYLVRNSAVLSGFAPSVHCIVDDYFKLKEAALGSHVSQDRAHRIRLDLVQKFAMKFARGRGGRYCEPFELEIQNDAPDVTAIVGELDGTPFTRLWAPILSSGRLSVLAGRGRDVGETATSPRPMSDLQFLTRLQARLMSTVHAKLGDSPFSRVEVSHANGINDEIHAETNHVLVVGSPTDNPAVNALFDWVGLSADGKGYRRTLRHKNPDCGLLTIAANPLGRRHGKKSFLFGATGIGRAAYMTAAAALLDDAEISLIVERALDVFSGRAPVAHIEIPVRMGRAESEPTMSQRSAAY